MDDQNKSNWYLKSDFGKSPNYIYKVNKKNVLNTKILGKR